ncbi:MAG: DNA recombination protein RmuC [Gammaproteobacteria bacterium]|nr:DNA recombination protein RmuC [Gammaproteobacteria bacterium]
MADALLGALILLAGAGLGLAGGWLLWRARAAARDDELGAQRKRINELETANTELAVRREEENRHAAEKLQMLTEAREKMAAEFENLANRIFDDKGRKFTEQSREVLTPLREQLDNFRKKVEETYEKESRDRLRLAHEITDLKNLNQQISEDAVNLTNALKGQVKTQGNWGEIILERVLEQSGLVKGREYEVQKNLRDDDGRRLRPDVVVRLPEGKSVIIDAKVSLVAYERYCSTEDAAARQREMKNHTDSLRSHIKGLGGKNYENLNGVHSPDFILMFVPVEAAFISAMEHDFSLFQEAFAKNIVMVSPSTLLATLRTIENTWRYERQNQNAREIASRAGDLYDKFLLFVDSLLDVGDKLDRAKKSWDTARKRLTDGHGNLAARAEQLKQLGADTRKSLPPAIAAEVDNRADPN